jgi:lipopolysaccharide/colanic/teichoic acid biosynthesis glycosyltransferase
MHMAGTDLGSPEADARAARGPSVLQEDAGQASAAGEPRETKAGNGGAEGAQLEQAVAVLAVSEPGAVSGLSLPAAEPAEGVALDPEALVEEFRDFDLELSKIVRLSLKRAFDVLASGAALLLLLPLFAAIAALVKLTDGGPVFFAQRRVGRRGQTFRMLKFRSMVVDAERLRPRLEVRNESSGPVFKMRLDPRVTAIGRFLRRYSLDELPQLINVLAGEMSIVGPRPALPSEVARYEAWQHRRFAVRPGLTCYWQVNPQRYQISFDEWMRLDLKYTDDWSLRLDLDLVLRTFKVVLLGTGT